MTYAAILPDSLRRLRPRHTLLSALLLVTIIALLWHHWGMNRYLRIQPASSEANIVTDLIADHFGTSHGIVRVTPDGWRADCVLGNADTAPYCGLDIAFGKPTEGEDWTGFQTMKIRYRYEQPPRNEEDAHLRLALFNFEPSYSTTRDYLSSKVEEVILLAQPGWQEREFGLNAFNVPAWWTMRRQSDPSMTATNFNHIVLLRLTTGYGAELGPHHFELAFIELHGKWISASALRLALIVMWLCAALLWLLIEWRQSLLRLHESKKQQKWLESANQSLSEHSRALATQVMIDPLTQVRNRVGLQDFLSNLWRAPYLPISVIFLDLDFFKKINDGYGHGVGDQVLVHFAAWVTQQIRPCDCLVRWGGEEFLLVSTSTSLDGAAKLAEKIRASMALASWPEQLTVTCSCGVAEMARDESFDSVVARADDALYRAKAAGRNRIELASASATSTLS